MRYTPAGSLATVVARLRGEREAFFRRTSALRLGKPGLALPLVSRQRVGRAGIRRPRALRKARARRLSGRTFLDHHSAQTRELPPSLRRLRSPDHRTLPLEKTRGADERRRDRSQSPED